MPEDLLQVPAHNDMSNPESACAYEAAIRAQEVTVGVEANTIKSPNVWMAITAPGTRLL